MYSTVITVTGGKQCPQQENAPLFLQTFDHCGPCGCPIFMKLCFQQAHVLQNPLLRAQVYVASLSVLNCEGKIRPFWHLGPLGRLTVQYCTEEKP